MRIWKQKWLTLRNSNHIPLMDEDGLKTSFLCFKCRGLGGPIEEFFAEFVVEATSLLRLTVPWLELELGVGLQKKVYCIKQPPEGISKSNLPMQQFLVLIRMRGFWRIRAWAHTWGTVNDQTGRASCDMTQRSPAFRQTPAWDGLSNNWASYWMALDGSTTQAGTVQAQAAGQDTGPDIVLAAQANWNKQREHCKDIFRALIRPFLAFLSNFWLFLE